MKTAGKQLDKNLAQLAWSLWTEVGVAGLERKHRDFSVTPEELIILTSALSEFDPRLRDEALDWCTRYHHFISAIHLNILAEKYETYIAEAFSTFSATVNAATDIRTKWVIFTKASPLKFQASGKSILRNIQTPSMVIFRLRSFLGVGIKSDVLSFLLAEENGNFVTSDLLETGYSKRRLATILEDLASAGILFISKVRNLLRYTFVKREQLIGLLGEIPQKIIHWNRILAVLLPIRACLKEVEDSPVGVRVIDMRNLLIQLSDQLLQLNLTPPPLQNDFEAYWNSVVEWVLDFTADLSKGKL